MTSTRPGSKLERFLTSGQTNKALFKFLHPSSIATLSTVSKTSLPAGSLEIIDASFDMLLEFARHKDIQGKTFITKIVTQYNGVVLHEEIGQSISFPDEKQLEQELDRTKPKSYRLKQLIKLLDVPLRLYLNDVIKMNDSYKIPDLLAPLLKSRMQYQRFSKETSDLFRLFKCSLNDELRHLLGPEPYRNVSSDYIGRLLYLGADPNARATDLHRTASGLIQAIQYGFPLEIFPGLLNAIHSDINNNTYQDHNALYFAIKTYPHDRCKLAIMLINSGANANSVGNREGSALHLAAQEGLLDLTKYLLTHHIPIDAKDREGFTPLLRAADCGQLEILKLLLESGANPNLYQNGHDALGIATLNRDSVKESLDQGASLVDSDDDERHDLRDLALGRQKLDQYNEIIKVLNEVKEVKQTFRKA